MYKEVHILLVEDNEGDIVLTKEAFEEAKILNRIDVARDGEQALQFLRKQGIYTEAQSPDIILLDINLPKIDGTEVLSAIKMDKDLKVIPVIILTTSEAEKDIMTSYYNHVNCYITKPVDMDKFMDVVLMIKNFWINIVKLPKIHEECRLPTNH